MSQSSWRFFGVSTDESVESIWSVGVYGVGAAKVRVEARRRKRVWVRMMFA